MTAYPKRKPVRLKGRAYTKEKKVAFERDKGCCVFCGTTYDLTPAHIVRRSQGGDDLAYNIMTACIVDHTEFDQYRFDLPEKVWARMTEEHREQYIKTRGGKQ